MYFYTKAYEFTGRGQIAGIGEGCYDNYNLIFHFGDIYPALVWVDETAVIVYSGYPQLTQI